jgi:hypothetical protein
MDAGDLGENKGCSDSDGFVVPVMMHPTWSSLFIGGDGLDWSLDGMVVFVYGRSETY